MEKTESHFEQVKTVLRRRSQGNYAALRESLRILIPHKWRRLVVNFFRSYRVLSSFLIWTNENFRVRKPSQKKNLRRGDFYEALTLRPHIPESDVSAILNLPVAKIPGAKPDIICFSIIDWSFRFQRPQQLMSRFAANGHRVFYLSTTRFISPHSRSKFYAQRIKENLFEVELAVRNAPDLYSQIVEEKNLEIILKSLDELRREFDINDAISYVMIPSWGKVALRTGQNWGWRVIYDCMDEWENFPGIKSPLLEMERILVERCQLLVVTAQRLFDKWSSYQRPMILARNAADYDFFQERLAPSPLLKDVPRPIIGYYGAIANWFDVDLLAEIAESRPNYSFVLLGGVFEVDVSRLRKLANVQLLGQQPYETMPQYLYQFDACVIPFKINPITEATDPVKLYEYLSGGKPVISVDLPELEPYRDHLYIAENPQDFPGLIDRALSENSPEMAEKRKEISRHNTWEARYRQVDSEIVKDTRRASVIIVTYNNLALTRLCLESLFRNTEYADYEVIVVDNNSSDETQKYLSEMEPRHENLKIILNQENFGFAKANNQGIRISTGEYIILLNNDTITPRGWMSRLLKHLDDPKIGIVGPVTNFVGNEARVEVPYQTWAELEDFAQAQTWGQDNRIADIHMVAMFCVAMRRKVFEEVGELDEQFGIGMFEDDDYSIRMKRKGYRVVCAADTFVHHFGQAAFGKLIPTGHYDRLFEENRAKYERKWGVTWEPHKNATLKFEERRPGTSEVSAALVD